jgi:hypothetical protein
MVELAQIVYHAQEIFFYIKINAYNNVQKNSMEAQINALL